MTKLKKNVNQNNTNIIELFVIVIVPTPCYLKSNYHEYVIVVMGFTVIDK